MDENLSSAVKYQLSANNKSIHIYRGKIVIYRDIISNFVLGI